MTTQSKKKVCHRPVCRKGFLYTCRHCGRKVCEHFCGNKDQKAGTASCVSCRAKL